MTGTSWTTIATIGIALMGIGDEEYDVNDVSYMNRSFTYIDALIPEMINIFRKNDYIDELMTYYL